MSAGGNWNNGVNAGARTVNLNNRPANVNTNNGVRLACESPENRHVIITVIRAVTDCQIVVPGPLWPNYAGAELASQALLKVGL